MRIKLTHLIGVSLISLSVAFSAISYASAQGGMGTVKQYRTSSASGLSKYKNTATRNVRAHRTTSASGNSTFRLPQTSVNTTGGGSLTALKGNNISTTGGMKSQIHSNQSSSRIVRTPLNNGSGVGRPIFEQTDPDLIILPTDPTNLPPSPPPETAEPNPPLVAVISKSIDALVIQWKDNSSVEDGYRLERKMEGDWILVDEFGPHQDDVQHLSQPYKFTDLSPDTEYCFRVVAFNEYGDSEDVDKAKICTSTYKAPPSRGCPDLESVRNRVPAPPSMNYPENGTVVYVNEDYTLPDNCEEFKGEEFKGNECPEDSALTEIHKECNGCFVYNFMKSGIVFDGNGNTLRADRLSIFTSERNPLINNIVIRNCTFSVRDDLVLPDVPDGFVYENVSFRFTKSNIVFDGNGNTLRYLRQICEQSNGEDVCVGYGKRDAFLVVNGESEESKKTLSNIVIRNTNIVGYQRGIRIKLNISSATEFRLQDALRTGLSEDSRALVLKHGMNNDLENDLRRMAPHCIYIENVDINHTSSVGLEVGAYAHDVTFDHGSVRNAGSPGIYLSFGTRFNTISNSKITGNGREGIALDASAFNHIVGNYFKDNERDWLGRKYGLEHIRSGGGIFLYKNAWEEFPEKGIPRYQHSEGNWIQNNEFVSEITGVWIGSRQSADRNHKSINPFGDDRTCGDPIMYEEYAVTDLTDSKKSYFRDYAEDTIVEGNTFTGGKGVVVEDDGARISGNRFIGTSWFADVGIKIGSRVRDIVGDPINDTEVRDNVFSYTVEYPIRHLYSSTGTRFCNNMVEYPNGDQEPLGLFPQSCDNLRDDFIKTGQTSPDKLAPVSTAPVKKEGLFKVDHTGPEILAPVSTTPKEKDKGKSMKAGVKVPVFNLGRLNLFK